LALSLAACGGAGSSLKQLVVNDTGISLASLAWLPGLTTLKALALSGRAKPMCLPAGISRLHHLTDARLHAAPLSFEAGCRLPTSLPICVWKTRAAR